MSNKLSCVTQVNFVGKLLGPQGNTIKRLQEDTGAKISVLGKGSMRDKNKVGFACCDHQKWSNIVVQGTHDLLLPLC